MVVDLVTKNKDKVLVIVIISVMIYSDVVA